MSRFRNAGVISAWTAIMLWVLIGIVGLTCDLSYVHLVGQQLQISADAAALGGAQYVHVGNLAQVKQQANKVGGANSAGGTKVTVLDNDIQMGRWFANTRTFEPNVTTGFDAVCVYT